MQKSKRQGNKPFSPKTPQKCGVVYQFKRKIYNESPTITKFLWYKMEIEEITRWVYITFVVIAIVMGIAVGYMAYSADLHWADPDVQNYNGWVTMIMLILGIIIGLTSITTKEVTPFLIATIALLVAGIGDVWSPLRTIEALQVLYYLATGILSYIVAFAAPAAVIIAIRSVLAMANQK